MLGSVSAGANAASAADAKERVDCVAAVPRARHIDAAAPRRRAVEMAIVAFCLSRLKS